MSCSRPLKRAHRSENRIRRTVLYARLNPRTSLSSRKTRRKKAGGSHDSDFYSYLADLARYLPLVLEQVTFHILFRLCLLE